LTGLASTGIAVAYNISVPIFGGFAPFIGAWLVAATGAKLLSDCNRPVEPGGPGRHLMRVKTTWAA